MKHIDLRSDTVTELT